MKDCNYELCACSTANDGHCMMYCQPMDAHDSISESVVVELQGRIEAGVSWMVDDIHQMDLVSRILKCIYNLHKENQYDCIGFTEGQECCIDKDVLYIALSEALKKEGLI